jgi:ABC-type antimicrobial peptide transport system permease subunit
MTQLISDSVSEPRFRTLLLGGFGASALVLISVGMVGVLGYSVTCRTREIGVRTALGAQRADVAMLVVKQALTTTLVGICVRRSSCLRGDAAAGKIPLRTSPRDPATFILIAAVLCVMALAASYVPARRAARLDPVAALRSE